MYIYKLTATFFGSCDFIVFLRCLFQGPCEGVTLEDCEHPLPMISFITTSSFDCEQQCKVQKDCLFFKFSESNGVCELFQSEFRNRCLNISGPLVSN